MKKEKKRVLQAPKPHHVNFADLVRHNPSSWGKRMDKKEEKHPSMQELELGVLICILEEVRGIKSELKRTRTIQ